MNFHHMSRLTQSGREQSVALVSSPRRGYRQGWPVAGYRQPHLAQSVGDFTCPMKGSSLN